MVKKILRWLLSNLLSILVIISVIYTYIYWGNLTGENTPTSKAVAFLSQKFEGVDEFVEGVKNKQARLAGTQPGQHSETESTAAASDAITADTITADTKTADTEKATVDSSESDQESLQQENAQLAVVTEETAIEKQGAVDINSLSQNTVEISEPDTNKSDNEAVDSAAVDTAESDSDISAVNAVNNEQTNIEQASDEKDESALAVTEQTDTSTLQVGSEQQPASISYSHNNTQVKQTSDGEVESLPQVQQTTKPEGLLTQESTIGTSSKPENDEANGGFVPDEVADQVENVKEDGALSEDILADKASSAEQSLTTQPSAMKGEMSIQDTWVLARKTFYQKDYALSEQSYLSVIAATKDNFDAYGELGNVYFSQGKKPQAADAYLRAATILFTKGHNQRAQSLLQVLQQLDMSKANQLQHLMDVPSL